MTSTSGHPAPEELDLLLDARAVAGSEPPSDGVDEHVAGCAHCTELLEEIAAVRELLHAESLRAPEMPADLGSRIAAALAAERDGVPVPPTTALPVEAPDGSAPDRSAAATVLPLERPASGARTGRPGGRVPRWAAVAAGVIVLGGAAVAAGELLEPSGSGADSVAASESAGGEQDSGGAASPLPPVLASGTDYAPAGLADQVRTLLTEQPLAASEASDGSAELFAATPDSLGGPADDESGDRSAAGEALPGAAAAGELLATPEGLAGCLEAIGAPGQTPEAVDLASWEGRDAAVIVLPTQGGHAVWVVGRDCAPGADGLVHYQSVRD